MDSVKDGVRNHCRRGLPGIPCAILVVILGTTDPCTLCMALGNESFPPQGNAQEVRRLLDEYVELSKKIAARTPDKDVRPRANEILKELRPYGSDIVPYVEALIKEPSNYSLRQGLMRIVARVSDVQVESLMMHLLLHDEDIQIVANAGAYLKWAVAENGELRCKFTGEDFELLSKKLLEGDLFRAQAYLDPLPGLSGISIRDRINVIVERLRLSLGNPPKTRNPYVYVSGPVYQLSFVLETVKDFPASCREQFLIARSEALQLGNSDLADWLALCLAANGDSSVLDTVKSIMLNHPDASVRYTAVPLYAAIAGKAGAEALREALNDSAISESMPDPHFGGDAPFVAYAAAEALYKLGEEVPSPLELREQLGIEVPKR